MSEHGIYRATNLTLADGQQSRFGLTQNGALRVFAEGGPSGTAANQVQGTSASGAADDGSNPVKMGGRVTTTGLTFTNGQRADLQMDANGGVATYLKVPGVNIPVSAPAAPADNETAGAYGITTYARGQVFNGTGWDKTRGDTTGLWTVPGVLPAAANRSGTTSATANTSTLLAAANPARRGLNIQNISANTIGINEFGGAAAIGTAGTYTIPAGGSASVRTTSAINVAGSAASSPYTATEF